MGRQEKATLRPQRQPFQPRWGQLLHGLSGSSSPAGPLVSALPAPQEATPTHRAGPSSAGSSTLHILSPLPPTHFLPWFLAFHCPEVNTPSHTRAAPGPEVGRPSPSKGGALRAHQVMRKKAGGGQCQPAWHPPAGSTRNPGIQAPAKPAPPHPGSPLPGGQAARGSRGRG